jgi:hypothetical protein
VAVEQRVASHPLEGTLPAVGRHGTSAARCRAPLAAALLAATLAGGCGADREGPPPATAAQQVRAVVARFGDASRAKDYQTICDQLLSRSLVQSVEAVGLPCESALQRGLGGVRDPRLQIREISIQGGRALVSVHTTAAGQPPSDDAVQLVRENGQWHIAALAEPTATTAAPAGGAPPPSSAVPSSSAVPASTATP